MRYANCHSLWRWHAPLHLRVSGRPDGNRDGTRSRRRDSGRVMGVATKSLWLVVNLALFLSHSLSFVFFHAFWPAPHCCLPGGWFDGKQPAECPSLLSPGSFPPRCLVSPGCFFSTSSLTISLGGIQKRTKTESYLLLGKTREGLAQEIGFHDIDNTCPCVSGLPIQKTRQEGTRARASLCAGLDQYQQLWMNWLGSYR